MSGFSSPSSSPRARSRSCSRSPTLNATKQLPSIPEDTESAIAGQAARAPMPPPYDEQDEERAALIREHLNRVFELVNEQPAVQQPRQHHHQQHQQPQRPFQQVQYNFDPEWHGAQASEFYQAARRRQQAQILGLLLFGIFIFSFLSLFVFFVVVGIRNHGRAAQEWEKRRQCLVSHGRAPHCQGNSPYNRW